MDLAEERSRTVQARLGPERAEEIEAELASHGLAVIDRQRLAELESQASGYRRLASLLE